MAKHFTAAESVRLALPDGEWIEIKSELGVGDARTIRKLLCATGFPDDPMLFRLASIYQSIVDWSFAENGKKIDVTEDAFNALDMDTLKAIREAIDQYTSDRSAEKNGTSGETKPEPISPSASS